MNIKGYENWTAKIAKEKSSKINLRVETFMMRARLGW
jgi:hypothetical protein